MQKRPTWQWVLIAFGGMFMLRILGWVTGLTPDKSKAEPPPPTTKPSTCDYSTATYKFIGAQRVDSAVPRLAWRVAVQPGLSRADLKAVLCRAAIDAHASEPGVKFGAVRVYGYDSEDDTEGAATAGIAVYAPDGVWANADPDAAYARWKMTVDLSEGYFKQILQVGAEVELADPDEPTVSVSRTFENWGDADIVARVKSGTRAEILSSKKIGFGEHTSARYEVRLSDGRKGWVSGFAVHPK